MCHITIGAGRIYREKNEGKRDVLRPGLPGAQMGDLFK